MRKTLVLAGLALLAGALMAISGATSADDPEPTIEPATSYTLYVPLVLKSTASASALPRDWCACASHWHVAAVEDGIRCSCASSSPPDSRPTSLYVGTGRFPSPVGGYGLYAGRSLLLFPDAPGTGNPTLRLSRVFVMNANAARCWIDVHAFTLPLASWTTPFTVTQEMWAMVGERLGGVALDIGDSTEITVTIPLSGFSPAMFVLSECESRHELCAADPYRYSWTAVGEVVLEWDDREP